MKVKSSLPQPSLSTVRLKGTDTYLGISASSVLVVRDKKKKKNNF